MVKTVSRNGHDLFIRPLRPTDTDRLLAFFDGLSAESRRLFRPYPFNRDDALHVTRDTGNARSTRLVIVEPSEEAIVAYGYFSESGVADPRYPILGIAITDRFQNQGLGRTFLETLMEEARLQGKNGLQLTVFKDNARAIHLYSALGFRTTGSADGGKQYAMRLELTRKTTPFAQRGVFLNPVPWGLSRLTADTWTAAEWTAYLDFLHAAGANMAMIYVWPAHYYHPDVPETLPNCWRYGVLHQALEHAHALGMQTCVGFPLNGVPPSVWQQQPRLRAVEVGYRGQGLCWSRGGQSIQRFPAFLMDALADQTDGFVLWLTGPAFCACGDCRDYVRVVREAATEYGHVLGGRSRLHLNLAPMQTQENRLGAHVWSELLPLLRQETPPLIAPEDQELRARLVEQGVSPLICEAGLEADACAEGLSLLPRPRLRQVDRLVAQNEGAAGILGQRIMPATQFVTDFVLMQKLLHPELANHEILRELGSCLYTETAYIFDFARAIWMLNSWWESGLRGELSEVDEGLSALPPDSLGMVAPLRDSVQLLRDLVYYLESGERHFDALVARVHARMADSPLFQGYTLDRVWQTRARNAVSAQVANWLEYLRRHLERAGV